MTKLKHKRPIRVRCYDGMGNASYIVVARSGEVRYISSSEVPLSLANLAQGKAAELRFALEDLRPDDADEAMRLVKNYALASKVELVS